MEVEFAFLADGASVPPDGKLYLIGGGFDTVWAQSFPVQHPYLALVVRLKLHPTECQRGHSLEIELWDPDGTRLVPSLRGEFSAPRNPAAATRPSFVQLVFNFAGLQLRSSGEHEFHILVDGQHLKSVPLYVQRGAPAGLRQEPPN